MFTKTVGGRLAAADPCRAATFNFLLLHTPKSAVNVHLQHKPHVNTHMSLSLPFHTLNYMHSRSAHAHTYNTRTEQPVWKTLGTILNGHVSC